MKLHHRPQPTRDVDLLLADRHRRRPNIKTISCACWDITVLNTSSQVISIIGRMNPASCLKIFWSDQESRPTRSSLSLQEDSNRGYTRPLTVGVVWRQVAGQRRVGRPPQGVVQVVAASVVRPVDGVGVTPHVAGVGTEGGGGLRELPGVCGHHLHVGSQRRRHTVHHLLNLRVRQLQPGADSRLCRFCRFASIVAPVQVRLLTQSGKTDTAIDAMYKCVASRWNDWFDRFIYIIYWFYIYITLTSKSAMTWNCVNKTFIYLSLLILLQNLRLILMEFRERKDMTDVNRFLVRRAISS